MNLARLKQTILGALSVMYRLGLKYPVYVLVCYVLLCGGALYAAKNFYFDASADSLIAQDDPNLLFYRKITEKFPGESFLVLTFQPQEFKLLSETSLGILTELVDKLRDLNGVAQVTSLLDAPLLNSPPVPLADLASDYKTLRSPDVDFNAALEELRTSPLYRDLLISADGQTTAIRITLDADKPLESLERTRQQLRDIPHPTREQRHELRLTERAYQTAYANYVHQREQTIRAVRNLRDKLPEDIQTYLGGVPMIASDMIAYARADMVIFGGSSLLLMMLMLYLFFGKIRWVWVPVLVTAVILLLTIGLLSILNQPVTVVSSNFISILIILAISVGVHLINDYRETLERLDKLPHVDVLCESLGTKLAPCFYTTLTTATGFASLTTSSIIPVQDFGWIMVAGVFITFVVFFTLFPALLVLLRKERLTAPTRDNRTPFIGMAYRTAAHHGRVLDMITVGIIGVTIVGVSLLSLHNRFPDYFRSSTEIRQGLEFIDRNLGGTMPMDIILTFKPYAPADTTAVANGGTTAAAEADDPFADPFADLESTGATADPFPERYWFTPDKITVLRRLTEFLEQHPAVGKVISLATLEEIARQFNAGAPLGAVEVLAVLGAIPADVRTEFIAPYANPREGLMRISVRLHEIGPVFSRTGLIEEIHTFAAEQLKLPADAIRVTGINVLFNGMLQELFNSQSSTLIFVVIATFLMFWVLLRSPVLSVLGLLPNILSPFVILGAMGLLGIPLDMMTITIVAIAIGIGVDDAIHYLHHFKKSFDQFHQDVDEAVRYSHRHIGRALYVTSLTVTVGFSVLAASNFVPSVYFGILTAAAMVLALLANLVLLPRLLLLFYR